MLFKFLILFITSIAIKALAGQNGSHFYQWKIRYTVDKLTQIQPNPISHNATVETLI